MSIGYSGEVNEVYPDTGAPQGEYHVAMPGDIRTKNVRSSILGWQMTLCTFGPPSERQRRWILKFEDDDVDDMQFDDEAEALERFRRMSDMWNCTLFVTAEL